MREIKFRAWDTQENEWLNIKHFGFDGKGLWYVQAVDSNERDIDPPYFIDSDDIELQQYTGLNDKNGTEIYEGDILKVIEVTNENMKEYVTDVIWEECAFFLKSGGSDYDTFLAAWASDSNNTYPLFELEVIGNVYENPEMLSEVSE